MIDIDNIYKIALKHYTDAKKNLDSNLLEHRAIFSSAISDVIPGFSADELEFGSYAKENFAVLFVDMRDSTLRAENCGPEKTFLTMHIFFTALLEVVKEYKGKVIDIMGDGLMVFFGGKESREKDGITKTLAMQYAGLCGRDMLTVREYVINKIISDEELGSKINIGIGVTFDSVIVTKIGIDNSFDVKAFGDCINKASKYAKSTFNRVKVSKKIKDSWPTGKGGTIHFTSDNDGYFLETIKR